MKLDQNCISQKYWKKYRKRILFTQLNNYIEFHSLPLNMYFFTVKWEIVYRCKQLKNTYFFKLIIQVSVSFSTD